MVAITRGGVYTRWSHLVSLKLPAVHAVQLALPPLGACAPGEHGMHERLEEAPELGLKVPRPQGVLVALVLPTEHQWPAAQGPVHLTRAKPYVKVPAVLSESARRARRALEPGLVAIGAGRAERLQGGAFGAVGASHTVGAASVAREACCAAPGARGAV